MTLVLICQNDQFSFGFLENTYLGLAQAATSVISMFAFRFVQECLRVSTKKMVSILTKLTVTITHILTVCRYKCLDNLDTAVGHDWDLDAEFWVGYLYYVFRLDDSMYFQIP